MLALKGARQEFSMFCGRIKFSGPSSMILVIRQYVSYLNIHSAMLALKGALQGFFLSISLYVSLKGCVEYIG
jgi:hypothetical protein